MKEELEINFDKLLKLEANQFDVVSKWIEAIIAKNDVNILTNSLIKGGFLTTKETRRDDKLDELLKNK